MKKKLKFALFALNSESGIAMTTSKKRWSAKINEIKEVAIFCDRHFDYIFSVQRWLGFGGKTDPAGLTYESSNFISALSLITKKIKLVVTMHTSIIHPTHAARILSTVDHFSEGRALLNVVCGWNEKEFKMFDENYKPNYNAYKQGEEWIKIFKGILSKKKISFKGDFFNVKNAQSKPVLYKNRNPKILSAAFSPIGREFALNNCDILVTMFSDMVALKHQVLSIKRKSKNKKKKFQVFVLCHIVCKRTDKEATEYYDDYSKNKADKIAVFNFSNIIAKNPKNKVIKSIQKKNIQKMAGGIGSYPIVGSPKKVIQELNKINNSGVDGVVVSFLNFKDEVKFFTQKVLNVINK
jgi:FMNH2-dependent dimethyl sulfone monooxygenase